jgi:SAM-dependent methyltransferase
MLVIPESEIRRHGPGGIVGVCWRQWRTERRLAHRGIFFRATEPARVAAAYAAMTSTEFDAINGPQDWANWRTIPRALSGNVPVRPLRVLDLGCGTGGSTRVLAFYCPCGSHITGYEFTAELLEWSRKRVYRCQDGGAAQVDFVCQGVTETLAEPDGSPVAPAAVDVASASGVVGHHLNRRSIAPLVQELCRVLKPGGVAMLDVGPTLGAKDLRAVLTQAGFEFVGRFRSWFGDPTGQMVFRLSAGSRA